jgi:hypothetical protein
MPKREEVCLKRCLSPTARLSQPGAMAARTGGGRETERQSRVAFHVAPPSSTSSASLMSTAELSDIEDQLRVSSPRVRMIVHNSNSNIAQDCTGC